MSSTITLEEARAEKLRRMCKGDPILYGEVVLKQKYWAKTEEMLSSIVKHRKVLVKASHGVGKTHGGGSIVNWAYDCFSPSITLSTAPSKAQVDDLLWKEVRVQRDGRPGLLPKASRLEDAPNHFAAGYTAKTADSFQGRHELNLGIVFDEGTGVTGPFWDAAEGMITGDNCWWLVILNPTDTASRAYMEETTGDWHVITISALDHPNIEAELRGLPPPFPSAVRLEWLEDKIRRWCSPASNLSRKAVDFEFPPGSGKWYRPGPLFEGRVMGRWPSAGTQGVWSDAAIQSIKRRQPMDEAPTTIGCDVARFGDDYTSVVVRQGRSAKHHEAHNGLGVDEVTGLLKNLCREYAQKGEDPHSVEVHVDDDGVGGGVTDNRGDFNFLPMSSAKVAFGPEEYPNRRSEVWFSGPEMAEQGLIDISRLSEDSQKAICTQLMAPKYKFDGQGRRVVEPKIDTKKRIRRSPDDADAFNNCYSKAQQLLEIKFW